MSSVKKINKEKELHITAYQLMILLVNMAKAIEHKQVGYQDAVMTQKQFFSKYRRIKLPVKKEEMERFLYSCNMLNEEVSFWHPSKESFDKFLVDLLRLHDFDKIYNTLSLKADKDK